MTDIVEILRSYAEGKGMIYHYGKKSTLNIIDKGNLYVADVNKIYFLHEFRQGSNELTSIGKIKSKVWNGKIFLLKNSDLDLQFYQEVGQLSTSKYKVNIEPLLNEFDNFVNSFACSNMSVLESSFVDITDAFDNNMDGILISYKIRVPI